MVVSLLLRRNVLSAPFVPFISQFVSPKGIASQDADGDRSSAEDFPGIPVPTAAPLLKPVSTVSPAPPEVYSATALTSSTVRQGRARSDSPS